MYKNKYFTRWRVIGCVFALALLAQVIVPVFLPRASAGTLTNTIVRFDRMNASQATTGTVCAVSPSAVSATETSVKVTFPTGYTLGAFGTWAVSTATTTGWPSGAVAWTGISAPTGSGEFVVSGQSVNFVSGNLASASSMYCFNWTNSAALTNKSSATNNNTGQVITQTTGGAASDTGTYATATVAATCGTVGCDQILVSATVGSTFSFSLSGNTAALPALTSANPVSATAINAIVSTNAAKGWNMWAADLGSPVGLRSASASKTIAYSPTVGSVAAALTANNEGYNIGAGTAGTGTCTGVTDDANFIGNASYKGGGLDGTLRSLAVSTGVADNCQLPLTVNASISSTTPPATDYTGTITVVAAGNF